MGFLKFLKKVVVSYYFAPYLLSIPITVFAEGLDSVNSEALNKTIELLNTEDQRNDFIKKNQEAQKTDGMVKDLMGDEQNTNQLYQAAAEIFRSLATQQNGDSNNMLEILQKAQQNPEGFYQNMTAEQKEMVRKLGEIANQKRQLNSAQ